MENFSVTDFLGWVLQRDLVRLGFHSDFYRVGIFLGFLIVFAFKVDFFFMIFFYDGSLLMMMEMGLEKMMVEMKCSVCSKGGYFE